MEKRNFVTPLRTSDESSGMDSLVDGAASLFGGGNVKTASGAKAESEYARKASAEDAKTDSLS